MGDILFNDYDHECSGHCLRRFAPRADGPPDIEYYAIGARLDLDNPMIQIKNFGEEANLDYNDWINVDIEFERQQYIVEPFHCGRCEAAQHFYVIVWREEIAVQQETEEIEFRRVPTVADELDGLKQENVVRNEQSERLCLFGGIAVDGGNDENDPHSEIMLLRKAGKVAVLEAAVEELKNGDINMDMEGAFALAFKSRKFPGQLVASRRGSPLLVGMKSSSRLQTNHFPVSFSKGVRSAHCGERPTNIIGFDSADWQVEYFVASDASAIIEHTKQDLYLEDDDVAFVEDGALTIHRIERKADKSDQKREVLLITLELQQIMLGNHRSFMQKEIFEQPDSVVNTMRGRLLPSGEVVLGGIKEYLHDIKRCRRLIMVACGTSYNSAIACRQVLEELSELPVVLELASDFLDRQTPIFRDDVCIFVSQSGETADTLMALRYCKPRGALLIGITNTVGSSICRESHCGIHINAGPEIGVASTKAYTSQILALLMFALSLSDDRISLTGRRQEIIDAMKKLPDFINEILALDDEVLQIAKDICKEKSLLIMGRGFNFATCLEGALKIKELSYMHCEGIMSGELKHGPLAMVDEKLRICMIVCNDHVYKKSLNALQQVVARGGAPIIIADQSVSIKDLAGMKHILRVPKTVDCVQNILTVIPLQLLAFHIAELNGQNVDRPRNLAKSVTVE